MAENMMMKVPENFNMEVLEKKLVEVYSMKGLWYLIKIAAGLICCSDLERELL